MPKLRYNCTLLPRYCQEESHPKVEKGMKNPLSSVTFYNTLCNNFAYHEGAWQGNFPFKSMPFPGIV
jgi:hypothetical protein